MRLTWGAILTLFISLSPLYLQTATAEYPVDQKSEQLTSEILKTKLLWLQSKLKDSLAHDKEKAHLRTQALGFTSVDELQDAQLNNEMRLPVFYMSLDKLRAYEDGSDPWPLLKRTTAFLYPIVVPGNDKEAIQIRSAAMVHFEVDEKGQTIRPHLSQLGVDLSIPIQFLSEARRSILAKSTLCDYFVISIPALKKRLLGVRREGTCDFKIIDIDLRQGLANALNNVSIQPAEDVFTALAVDARSNKYDMPLEPGQ